jgi:outer membrane receptor for ferrienterochelin and colicin
VKFTLSTIIGLVLLELLMFPAFVYSQHQTSTFDDDIFEMSLEDLLNQRVTTVSKSKEKTADAPGIVSVLTREDIKRFGGLSLSSVLERIPGLTSTSAAFSDRSIIASRGEQISSTSNHVLLLINGRPVREILEGGVSSEMYETFPVSAIERIEVIKGPGSVLYGSNAFSGVINVITKIAEGNDVTITGLTGREGAVGANANVTIKSGDFSLIAAGSYLKKPEWETNYTYANNAEEFELTQDEGDVLATNTNDIIDESNLTSSTILSSNISIPNVGTGLYLGANYKNFSFMSSYNLWETTGFDSPGIVQWKKNFNSLGYDLKLNENWISTFNVNLTNSKLDTDSFPNIHRDSYEFLAEWTNNVTLSEKAKLVFGGLYTFAKGKETNTINEIEEVGIDAQRQSFGCYAQADYQLFESVKLTAGLQLNKIENMDPGIVPRFGVIWNPKGAFSFKGLYSQAYRAPGLSELALDQPFRQGNSELLSEEVATFDLEVNYQRDRLQLRLNYFHSDLNNIIILNTSYSIPQYENLGALTFHGGEIEGKYYFSQAIFVTTSALYQTNEDDNSTEDVTTLPNFSAKAGISYQSKNGITIGLFDLYQGKLSDSFITTVNPSPEKAYNCLNLHSDFDLNKLFGIDRKQKVSLLIHADNLLNKEVWIAAKGEATSNSIPFNQGRVVYAGFNIAF